MTYYVNKNIYFQPSYKCEGVWDKRMGVAGVVVVATLINLVAAEVGDANFLVSTNLRKTG